MRPAVASHWRLNALNSPASIRVSLVEDDLITRESLVRLIDDATDLQCLHAYPDAEQAILDVPQHPPDVLVVDLNLPGTSGNTCIRRLKEKLPQVQILVLTTFDDTDNIFDSLRSGASGYLLKRSTPEEIIAAIKEVHEGGSPMSMNIARKVVSFFHPVRVEQPASPDLERLTSRELQILEELAKGGQYRHIAEALGIAASTVRAHLHTIYGKLHVRSRSEAVLKLGRK